jgi:DNA-binding NarL/FixJ family response regulator
MIPLRAFIVEDNHVIAENLVAALEEVAPVEVVGTAADEASAVRWLLDHPDGCDVAIVDIFLKGGSGLGVLAAARHESVRPVLVALTNYATPEMRRKCMELGATRVYDKPQELEELIDFCVALGATRRDG